MKAFRLIKPNNIQIHYIGIVCHDNRRLYFCQAQVKKLWNFPFFLATNTIPLSMENMV